MIANTEVAIMQELETLQSLGIFDKKFCDKQKHKLSEVDKASKYAEYFTEEEKKLLLLSI